MSAAESTAVIGPDADGPVSFGREGDGPVTTTTLVRQVGLVGPYVRAEIVAPAMADRARPGQFVAVEVPGRERILPRPFSIAEADPEAGTLTLVFAAVGEGTRDLARSLAAGATSLRVTGPLGHAYQPFDGPAVVVGGGYGAAPLTWLARTLPGPAHLVVGAASRDRLCLPVEAHDHCASVHVTTVDGSEGTRGLVTDVLADVLESTRAGAVYACGPMPMLRAVGAVSADRGLPCQVAMEEHMACGGVGVCMTCVVALRNGDGAWHHRRVCTDGPVVDERRIAWEATRWA